MNALKVLDGAGMDRGITVLAAAYNGRDYIEEQMDSILAQGQGGNPSCGIGRRLVGRHRRAFGPVWP